MHPPIKGTITAHDPYSFEVWELCCLSSVLNVIVLVILRNEVWELCYLSSVLNNTVSKMQARGVWGLCYIMSILNRLFLVVYGGECLGVVLPNISPKLKKVHIQ